MKKIIRNMIVLLIVFVTVFQPVAAKVEFSQELYEKLSQNKNPIPRIEIPDYRRIVLKNGLIVYLAEDPQIPVLVVNGTVRWGRSLETKKNAGISNCMVDMMTSGTQNFSEKEMDHYQESNAIQFDLNADDDYFSFNGNALISEEDQLISLVAEILQRPNFKADYFNRKKSEWEKYLRESKTKENNLMNMYFYSNLFQNHPYSFNSDPDLQLTTLNRVTPESLTEYYDRVITPNNTILFVHGDFKPDQMEEKINKYFGGWVKKEIKAKPANVKDNKATYGQVVLVNKRDATQAKIKMGYIFFDESFLDQNMEERVAFEIANQIYGGGDFESYLMNEIRSEKGFAYDISAGFFNHPLGGAYFISTSVKPDKAYETIETVKKIMSEVKNGKKKIEETEVFKIVNQRNAFFPEAFRYDESIIKNLIANVEFKNRDSNYLNKYIRLYNKVTASMAQMAFAKYTFPEKFFTVIVGKKEEILPQFKEEGVEVKVIEIEN